MTIHLNLTPDEAVELRRYITNRGGSILASVENKLTKQAHKFATAVQVVPGELKLPGTGNINLAQPRMAHELIADPGVQTYHRPAQVPTDPMLATLLIAARTKALDGRDPNYNKIAVIKAIREVVGGFSLGLGDAKWACENWPAFINFVERNGRLPEPGFSYQPMR
jgi:hypothetical protein